MFSLEAEHIITQAYDAINEAIEKKTEIDPLLSDRGLDFVQIEKAIQMYPGVKNRRPDVLAKALLMKANVWGMLVELREYQRIFW